MPKKTAEHTPGPWKEIETPHRDAPGVFAVVSTAEGYESTICYTQMEAKGDPIANARLIAAAPELLEHCKRMFNVCTHPKTTKSEMKQIAREAMNTIAKAEGRA